MGPARDSTAKLLYEKDQEISALKLQLKAHAAQTALIQNRLLVTQSALDALQTTHDEELRAAQTTANRLRKRLNASYEHVKLCEEQKDDLRDAVSSFLQRVEEPRNIWPQSQLHISSLLEPLDPKLLMHRNQDVPAEYGDDLMSRASSMIETLVCERDLAREAYRSLYKDAKMQIAALEAELAHRDYELEKCLMHHVDRRNDQGKAPTRNHLKPFTPLDPETVKKVLQETSIRHKILELGNEKLEKP
ncbi:hypothetical protein GYMLUDRAFT_508566 [Collybiopsis luxurians FD-317 M1]|nr:hypothetical protein GYMLUDRAFT_508566 [Collybiopsis luxurians FD-317 M1]